MIGFEEFSVHGRRNKGAVLSTHVFSTKQNDIDIRSNRAQPLLQIFQVNGSQVFHQPVCCLRVKCHIHQIVFTTKQVLGNLKDTAAKQTNDGPVCLCAQCCCPYGHFRQALIIQIQMSPRMHYRRPHGLIEDLFETVKIHT